MPSLADRNLSFSFYHRYQPPYEDIQMTIEILDFVDSRVSTQTPSEIYLNYQTSWLLNIENILNQ